MDKHIGFPLPSEMFHPHLYCVATEQDKAMCKLLDIPLKCMVCGKKIENGKTKRT